MNVEEFKKKKKLKKGFGFNKGRLNLNIWIKSNQYYKIIKLKTLFIKEFWWKKFEMMLSDYPHSKNTHNLWNLKFFKKINLLNKNLKIQESITTCKWGVMYMTSKQTCSLGNNQINHKIINIFSYNLKLR
jgi:hypothetical protein